MQNAQLCYIGYIARQGAGATHERWRNFLGTGAVGYFETVVDRCE